MKKYLVFFLIIGFTILISCIGLRKKDNGKMCTEEYRMLTISIRDSNAKPVILSDYFVRKTSTGEIIDFAQEDPYFDSISRIQGIYLICTDGMMGMTSLQGTEFEFHGMLDSAEVVNEQYIIGNDECHVMMIAGQPVIVISK